MNLITSAAFVGEDLQTEYGNIPPSFLPIKNGRLFEQQRKLFPLEEKIYISLPESFNVSDIDLKLLKKNNFEIVNIPSNKSLSDSIIYALNTINLIDESLFILHGDTLFKEILKRTDVFGLSHSIDNYCWDRVNGEDGLVYSGFFSFSCQNTLIKSLQDSDFIKGLEKYKNLISVDLVEYKNWYDCGHSNTYFRTKKEFTTEREFNDLKISDYSVTKTSNNTTKINAELNWFNNLPKELKKFIPSIIDYGYNENGLAFYEIEFYPYSNLSELYVFGNNESYVWRKIISKIFEFIEISSKISVDKIAVDFNSIINLYEKKTYERLNDYSEKTGVDLNSKWKINNQITPSINDIVKILLTRIKKFDTEFYQIIHGDLCFSNILYSFRNQTIKVIDPRGLDEKGNRTVFGDLRYDLSKLTHSIIGLYDFIIAGRFEYSENSSYDINFKIYKSRNIKKIQKNFFKINFNGKSLKDYNVLEIQILLFLSMLPLHSDNPNRQKALLVNALRLFNDLK